MSCSIKGYEQHQL